MIAVKYHDDLKEVQGDAALTALLDAPHAAAPFDRLAWWQGLVEICGIDPLLVVAGDGEHRAVLALAKRDGQLAALANWYSFRFAPVASHGAKVDSLFTAMARDLARQTHRIILDRVPDENGEAALLVEAFRKAGWVVNRSVCDTNHVLAVGGRSYAQYLADRPGALRTTLKRKSGRVTIELFDRFDASAWEQFEAIYSASWKPEEGSPEFLRRFVSEEGAAGRLRLGLAHAEGRAVAAQFWTVEAGTAFIHKLAHREDAKALSPGTTLSAALFERVIDQDRVSLIDFGTGNDGYKRDWMEAVRHRYRLDLIRPTHPANWAVIARHALRSLAGDRSDG